MGILWREDMRDYSGKLDENGQYPMHSLAGSVTDTGKVLSIEYSRGSSYSSDDTYAVVWNSDTKQCERRVLSSMFGTFGNEKVVRYAESWSIDATPELQAEVKAILEDRAAKEAELRWLERNLKDALEVDKNKMVEVVKGKKVAKGTKGIVKWIGVDDWGTVKVGMLVEDNPRLVYTAKSNVKVVLPPNWNPTEYACDATWE